MDKKQLGAFIAENRRCQHMTQQQLAQMLYITDKAVSKWERGLSYPDVTLLEPLATALGMTTAALIRCDSPAEEKENAMEEKKPHAENETLRAVAEMADDSKKQLQRQWLTGTSATVATLLLVIILLVIENIHTNLTNPYRNTEAVFCLVRLVWIFSITNRIMTSARQTAHGSTLWMRTISPWNSGNSGVRRIWIRTP